MCVYFKIFFKSEKQNVCVKKMRKYKQAKINKMSHPHHPDIIAVRIPDFQNFHRAGADPA